MIRVMKKIRYVLLAFLFAIAGLLVVGGEQKVEAATPKEQLSVLNKKQKASLKNLLTELINTGDEKAGSDFSLIYITDDDIPEIDFTGYFYNPEKFTGYWYAGIIYFKGNKAEIYSTYSEWYEYDYVPRSGIVCESGNVRGEEVDPEYFTIPDLKKKTKAEYEAAKKKKGESPQTERIGYYDLMLYLGYPELAYDVYTKVDLNGDGKKEAIGIRAVSGKNDYNWYSESYSKKTNIFINNISKYEGSYDWSQEGPISIEITDINPSDKFKELVILSYGGHGEEEYTVFRYKNKKLNYLFSAMAFYINDKPDDTVALFTNTASRLGVLGIRKDYKITKDGLVAVKNHGSFEVAFVHWYSASEDIKVYKNSDKKRVVNTIKAGESFAVTKIMYKYNKEEKGYTCQYAYVDTKDKKNAGWIYIEGYASPWEGNFMVSNYMWYD